MIGLKIQVGQLVGVVQLCDGTDLLIAQIRTVNSPLTNGKRYYISFEITAYTAVISMCLVKVYYGGFQVILYYSNRNILATKPYVRFYSSAFNGSIDNVSVKEYTSADMDVTRATAATRVDENGLVNYAEIIGGEEVTCGDFECAVPLDSWSTGTGWSIGSGLASCDGTQTGSSNLTQNINITTVNKLFKIKFSVTNFQSGRLNLYVGGINFFESSGNGNFEGYVNVTNASSDTNIYLNANSLFEGSVTNISVKEVTRDNVPRIDYTGGGCPHILAEPQRTNLITYSEDFSNAAWQKSDITATPNSITSPDGTLNAYKLTKPTSSTPRLFELSVYPSTGVHTFTAFYKNLDGDSVLIRLDGGGNTANCTVDLTTNTLVNSGANIISSNITQLSDGWIRVSVTANILSTSWVLDAVNLFSISVGSSVYIWGAQLEVGSYATSYIPTSGSTVTRNQDIFTRDGIANLINSTEGVLFVEMAA